MVEALAGALDVPLRERNRLLLAAGYAPRYAAPRLLSEVPSLGAWRRILLVDDEPLVRQAMARALPGLR